MCHDVLVSVIIPIYNIESYIRRCVDSVRKQTHHKLEIILVNDGSTDNSSVLCEQFAREDDRIIVIHQENRGPGEARNTGLDIARGEWLCFVDGDDFISVRFVELLLRAAFENDCLTAQCKYIRGTDSSMKENSSDPEITVMDWRNFLFLCLSVYELSGYGFCLNICHRSLFSNIKFPGLRYSEDAMIVPQIYYTAKEKQIAVVNCVLYYYFQRSDSCTKKETTLDVLDHSHAIKQLISFWEEKKEYDLYDIYWYDYFQILIDEYINLSRDLPQMSEKYMHLMDEILENIGKAKCMCHTALTIPVGGREAWDSFFISGKPLVMYGFGDIGMKALPWIKYFQLPIAEIWDKRATGNETVEGVLYCSAHSGLNNDIPIIIALADPYVALTVRNELRQMGYRNFISCRTFEASFRYAKYKRFLPFLLEG